ncbi:M56 family metallopeptidase [Eilatimonas milleporae]|uniref:Beta-lactamase regulating signal transducer with metallopeptidase domain n=1 Tax=Eilatimonas milleporae TaxID=911205 RepID=A0A3M0CIJ3_9PROT|nr:M56 family metallopeptidase [Eilatimonas milleporae]RMB08665.1 beta-lactamase regulating signal transducer with metallopeptidase domain [Eilatimonas milleporae]
MTTVDVLNLMLRATLSASAAILLVLALRGTLRHLFGARIAYAFWMIVPAAFLAAFLPARRIFTTVTAPAPASELKVIEPVLPQGIDMAAQGGEAAASLSRALPFELLASQVAVLWAVGFLVSVGVLLYRQRRFLRRHGLHRLGPGLHISGSDTVGPFVVGLLKNRVVLPANFTRYYNGLERHLIIQHEYQHIRSKDMTVLALAALMRCINWFNPLFYTAFHFLKVDQELACDEGVMRKYGRHRRTYAEAMLKAQLASQMGPLACAWPPKGAVILKQRIARLDKAVPPVHRWRLGAGVCVLSAAMAVAAVWTARPAETVYILSAATAEDDATDATDGEGDGPTLRSIHGRTLVTALKDGLYDEARILVEAGADVDYYLRGDGTPLVVAAQQGQTDVTTMLIAAGADVNRAAPGDGNPLIMAAARGHMDIVRLLIENGADVNAYVPGDETPLINAAARGRLEIARYLVAHGADVNLTVDSGNRGPGSPDMRSPLGQAQRFDHDGMARFLVGQGARPVGKEQ